MVRSLRCVGRLPTQSHTSPSPTIAAAAIPVLDRLVFLLEQMQMTMRQTLVKALTLRYLANIKCIDPDPAKAENSLLRAIELLKPPEELHSAVSQVWRLNAFRELFHVYLSTQRPDEALSLLRDAREATKSSDPQNVWQLTKLARENFSTLGLDRATAFALESVEHLRQVSSPTTKLFWRSQVSKSARWQQYTMDCSKWLVELQNL
jgi:hypothetical protein